MSKNEEASSALKIKVGLFTLVGLLLLGGITVFVNDRPYWWRACEVVHINVDDATGLKEKSSVRSLGIEIGYLYSIDLTETYVRLGICITAPVEVLPSTRAYIRGEGFLGDKFVELKPVKYLGKEKTVRRFELISSAYAEDPPAAATKAPAKGGSSTKEIPVGDTSQDMQHLINQVDGLVTEVSELTGNLKKAINPEELRSIMQQLNKTLENAAHTLSPQGGLTTTAQRVLSKLEDSIEQLRDMLTRMNQGKGSLGMLINDPVYAEELREVLRNANKFLNKAAITRFVVDISASQIPAYDGGRGVFQLSIWTTPDRYYRLGVTIDARGKTSTTTTTTTVGGASTTVETTQVEKSGFQLTGMLGKVFWSRLDGSVGFLHGDGTMRFAFYCGPYGDENRIEIGTDIYVRSVGNANQIHDRVWGLVRPFSTLYLTGGVDSFRKVGSKLPLYFGAGLAFDDDDIKMLFTFL